MHLKLFSLILFFPLFIGCAHRHTYDLSAIDRQKHNQVIIVSPTAKTRAVLTLWQFEHHQWNRVYGPIPAVVGRSGIAPYNRKKEGDGFTPSGIFEIPYAFGYDSTINSSLKYRQATSNDFWVDDSQSEQYNQWVSGAPLAKSFEKLKRDDELYRLALVINYNIDPIVPGKGSAIFLHIWRNYYDSTAGCVAINKRHLRRLVSKLKPNLKPIIHIYEKSTESHK